MTNGPMLLIVLGMAVAIIILLSTRFKVHPFLALLTAALFTGLAAGQTPMEVLQYTHEGFAAMMKKIGLVVVMGTCIGTILEKSGAILRVAQAILHGFGKRRAIHAITWIGMLVGVPIFCDSGYIILSGLPVAIARQSGKPYGALVGGLASGLYITHCLLPPHPGSIAGAAALGLKDHLGTVIFIGIAISLPVTLLAAWACNRWMKNIGVPMPATTAGLDEQPDALPSLWLSLAPILLPVLLIALGAYAPLLMEDGFFKQLLLLLGQPLVALIIGFLLSLFCLSGSHISRLKHDMQEAVAHAGSILIVVGAGGIFGEVLKHTALPQLAAGWMQDGAGGVYMLLSGAWLLGILLKTAQGSTTSAIIIGSGMLAPVAATIGIDTPMEGSLLLAALSGGAMAISHTNDAYFWVIGQFAGISVKDTFRVFSTLSVLLSIAVLMMVWLLAWLML